jgi:hypothetical protein
MYCRSKYIRTSRKYLSKRNFKVPAGVGVVSIKGIERILRHYIRLSKSRSGFLRLENAQIAANFGLIFAVCISCIEVLKTRKQGFETAGDPHQEANLYTELRYLV